MNYKQEIENVLFDNPQHYLMAGGGEGMEFMSTLISNHSTKYWKNESLITDKNRSHVKLPWFYTIMSNMITYDNSILKMIDDLYNLLVEHTAYNNEQMSNRPGWHHNPEDMNSCISNVKNFYSTIDKPPLIKTHFSNSDYFTKDNTFFIYPDEYKWFEYKWHMWYRQYNCLGLFSFCSNDLADFCSESNYAYIDPITLSFTGLNDVSTNTLGAAPVIGARSAITTSSNVICWGGFILAICWSIFF